MLANQQMRIARHRQACTGWGSNARYFTVLCSATFHVTHRRPLEHCAKSLPSLCHACDECFWAPSYFCMQHYRIKGRELHVYATNTSHYQYALNVQTYMCLPTCISYDSPPSHTHTHTPTNVCACSHSQYCLLSAVCIFLFLQALLVLNYLILNGSERVVTSAREHIYDMKSLEEYTFRDEHGKDQGINGISLLFVGLITCCFRCMGQLLFVVCQQILEGTLFSLLSEDMHSVMVHGVLGGHLVNVSVCLCLYMQCVKR